MSRMPFLIFKLLPAISSSCSCSVVDILVWKDDDDAKGFCRCRVVVECETEKAQALPSIQVVAVAITQNFMGQIFNLLVILEASMMSAVEMRYLELESTS